MGVNGLNIKKKFLNTTFDTIQINKILKKLKEKKIENVILEASSHGLNQNRLDGLKFDIGIFTNLTRDHLDYHKTFKNYFNSKLILFKKFTDSVSKGVEKKRIFFLSQYFFNLSKSLKDNSHFFKILKTGLFFLTLFSVIYV